LKPEFVIDNAESKALIIESPDLKLDRDCKNTSKSELFLLREINVGTKLCVLSLNQREML